MTKIIPAETNLLVERVVKGSSKGGIIIPDAPGSEKVTECVVIEAGPGKILDDGTYRKALYKKGDTLLFIQQEYAKREIDVDGKVYLLLSERDILAKVTK